MNKTTRNTKRRERARRVRSQVSGTAQRPRVNVFRSLTAFSAQVIDDVTGKTLAASSTGAIKADNTVSGAQAVGEALAKQCKELKIETIVFDRAGYKYHGKVKSFADALREGGINF